MKHAINTVSLASLLTAALLVGCSNQPPKLHGEDFTADGTPTSVGEFNQAQCAAGAREDGMLYDVNFDGGDLNSLGQVKLDLMVKGTPAGQPVTVYLNMPHDQVAQRQLAVSSFLKGAGVPETRIVVAEGPNPNKTQPTAYNIGRLYKHDGGTFDGEGAPEENAGAAAPAGGGMGGGVH